MIRTWKVFVQDKLNIVTDNKHVLLPWLVSHAGVIITRYKKVHDGKTAYQKIKNKSPSNKMMPLGEKVVWMMPKDNHRRNKLEPMHQFGVFVEIVPRTGEFVVLTPEGALLVRTVHRLSEDRRWDAEFISQVRVLHGISNPAQVKELKKAFSQKEQIHFLLILQWTYRRECERGECTSAEWKWRNTDRREDVRVVRKL